MLRRIPSSPLLALLAVGTPLAAQGEPLVLVGDTVPGVGDVIGVFGVSIHDSGSWTAFVRTDHPNPSADDVLLKDGAVFLREGDPLGGGPKTFSLLGNTGFRLDAAGNVTFNQTQALDVGDLVRNAQYLLQNGDPVGAAGISPGSIYLDFGQVAVNDAGQVLTQLVLEDPAIPGTGDHAVARFQVDPSGAVTSEEVLLKEGDAPFGVPITVDSFVPITDAIAMNESGATIVAVRDPLERGILVDGEVVAELGGFGPLFGTTWSGFDANVDIGDGGDYAFTGRLHGPGGTRRAVVWNGQLVAQVGDELEAFAPFELQDVTAGPFEPTRNVFVDADGRILWFADWDDPDTSRDTGLMLDHELILQEGVSLADGARIDELAGSYELSDDGRYLVFSATLDDGRAGAFRLDLEASVTPYAGCAPNPATLTASGLPWIGGSLTFQLDGEQGSDVAAFVALSLENAAAPCGPVIPGAGELLVGDPFGVVELLTVFLDIGLPAFATVPIPDQIALIGLSVHGQGLFVDALPGSAEPLRLSDGVAIVIGD